ncbi:hypothetical protein IV203_012456 [Nitzschia inconspicua]|uniref:Uncharacterized protein n=1 Tax=Nitzschia inconspicua TaxID=303405 RepID=A0A9K3PLY6_9STRA|nr:hypothetical protein IV203_012456 [Nitzschia inconspicua]
MDFLSQKPELWLSIEDDNNEMVMQAKHFHQLTWIQKRVVVKGLPLPELHATDGARESTFEDDCEVECQIPDTIKNLQLSQRNAVTSLREKRNAGNAQVREMVRTALNLADQGTAYTEILLDHLQEAIHQISHAIASGKPNQKRGSEYAFPETGRSKQRCGTSNTGSLDKCCRRLKGYRRRSDEIAAAICASRANIFNFSREIPPP